MKAPIAMSSNGGDDSQTKALKDSCLPPPVSDPNPAAQHPSRQLIHLSEPGSYYTARKLSPILVYI